MQDKITLEEQWATIDGFNGFYQISNFGRIRSIDRTIFNHGCNAYQNVSGRFIKTRINKDGYEYTVLYNSAPDNKVRKTFKIHRLVALYFCEGYKPGLHVNHIDGNRGNNIYSNLEWCTPTHNARHKYLLGYTTPSGENSSNAKLKDEYIPIISRLYMFGVPQTTIANAFGVSQVTISRVINNETYKDLKS